MKFSLVPVALAGLLLSPGAFAQTAAQNAKKASPGGFTFSAGKQVFRANGARLEGNARIKSPQLDAAADVIAFDFTGSQVEEVRARGNVQFKVDLVPKGGGPASHVEASAKSATLKVDSRTLILEGNVNGFYQPAGGAKNSLSGSRAVLNFNADKSLLADLEGGAQGVRLELPAENSMLPTAIGTVIVTAEKASVNTVTGVGQFSGKARAVSTDAANKFDVSAPAFVVTRSANNSIDTLKTTGRTTIKIDYPPDAAPAAAPVAAADGTKQIGKPTHFEVAADGAVVRRSDNTMVLEGNVSGFYDLAKADGSVTRQQFSGDKAVVKYVLPEQVTAESPAGLQVEITGKPVTIEVPQFGLNF